MIHLANSHLIAILDHAQQSYPCECCGLLIGTRNDQGISTITKIAQSPNMTTSSAADTFELDPQIRFEVMRNLRGGHEEIIGHYHSHPDHPAQPSKTDLNMAFEPDLIWLIASVTKNSPGDVTAWRLNRDTQTIKSVSITIS